MSRSTRRGRRGPVLVLVVLAVGAFLLWTRPGDTAPAAAGTPTSTPTTAGAPSPAPSSAAPRETAPSSAASAGDGEPTATEEAGEPSSEPTPTPAPADGVPAGGLRPVDVGLTYTGYDPSGPAVVAGGYAADVVEEDATCTLVLRREGVELRGDAPGTPGPSTTDCGEVRVGGDALTSGTWEAVLSYASETSAGESAAVEVLVP